MVSLYYVVCGGIMVPTRGFMVMWYESIMFYGCIKVYDRQLSLYVVGGCIMVCDRTVS